MMRSRSALVIFVVSLVACHEETRAVDPAPSAAVLPAVRSIEPTPVAKSPIVAPAKPAKRPPSPTVAIGGGHMCAVVQVGDDERWRVKCWGENDEGQLGLGDLRPRGAKAKDMGAGLPFVALDASAPFVAVGAGASQSCALQRGGKLWCWGRNSGGELGLGDLRDRGGAPDDMAILQPVNVGGDVVAFSMSSMHTCVLLGSGELRCWGANTDGQLGAGDSRQRGGAASDMGTGLPAVALGTGVRVDAVAAGDSATCVWVNGDAVKCFGSGRNRGLGLPDARDRGKLPEDMGDALPFARLGATFHVAAISSGSTHTCALSTDQRVKCWGENRLGQLGLGHTRSSGIDEPQEADLGTIGKVVAVVAGNSRTCALIERGRDAQRGLDNGVKCWGSGAGPDHRHLIDMGDALPFVDLGADLVPMAVTVGGLHFCATVVERARTIGDARPTTGRLKCWGDTEHDAIGVPEQQRSTAMGDELPFVDLGADVRVVLPQ